MTLYKYNYSDKEITILKKQTLHFILKNSIPLFIISILIFVFLSPQGNKELFWLVFYLLFLIIHLKVSLDTIDNTIKNVSYYYDQSMLIQMYKNKVTKHLYFDTINEFQIDKSHSLILHSSSTSETIILLDKIEIKSSLQKKLKQSVNSHQSKNITAKLLGKNVYYSICYMAFFNHFITDNSILTAIFFMIMPTYIAYLFIQYFLIKGKSEINSQLEEKLLVKEKGKQ